MPSSKSPNQAVIPVAQPKASIPISITSTPILCSVCDNTTPVNAPPVAHAYGIFPTGGGTSLQFMKTSVQSGTFLQCPSCGQVYKIGN